jgi:hypothetical protein
MYLMLLDLVAPGRVYKSALGSPCTHHQHGTQALSVRAGKTFCSAYQKKGGWICTGVYLLLHGEAYFRLEDGIAAC